MKNVFTFLLLLFSLLCNGQSPKLFTTDKELSSSLINQIYQDRNGFIWIATEDGLNRYDGAKFTIYKHEPNNEHSLAHNFVRTVFEDSKGHLLIGTYIGIHMIRPRTILLHLPNWKIPGKRLKATLILSSSEKTERYGYPEMCCASWTSKTIC